MAKKIVENWQKKRKNCKKLRENRRKRQKMEKKALKK